MNADAYNRIVDTLNPVFTKKNMKPVDGENGSYFKNEECAVRVIFDEKKNLFKLQSSTVPESGEPDDWKTASEWLFMPDYGEKDASSIASDFKDTLEGIVGLRARPSRALTSAAMPDKGNGAENPNAEALLGRFLTIFPQYKTAYETHVQQYGDCIMTEFLSEYAQPQLRELLKAKDKKRLQKYFEMLNEVYTMGTKDAQALVSVVMIGGALQGQPELAALAHEYMAEYPYLDRAVSFVMHRLK